MAITTGANDGLKSINAYYKAAMLMPVEQLQAIVRGTAKDSPVRIPATIAMMALEAKMPQVTAAQGQQAAQQPQQPSVRDQMEGKMAMLPEDVGVGALPAQNMESMDMAEGGIVAFKDKGFVDTATEYLEDKISNLPNLPGWSMVAQPMFKGATYGEEARRSLESPDTSSPIGRFFENFRAPDARQKYEEQQKFLAQERALAAKLQQLEGYGLKQQTPQQQAEAKRLRAELDALRGTRTPTSTTQSSTQTQTQTPAPAPAPASTPLETYNSITTPSAPAPAQGKNNRKTRSGTAQARPGTTQTDLGTAQADLGTTQNKKDVTTTETKKDGTPPAAATSDLKSLIKDVTEASGANKIAEGYTGIESLIEKQNKDELARYKQRPQYEPYKKYEESLKSDEEKVKDKKNQNFQMALVNAGLAIMSGSSRYALQNIGQGAMVGTKQYNEGIKDLEAAAKERQKAFAMIEEARNAKADKDFDRYDTMMNRQAERGIKAKELSIEGIAKVLNVTVPQATNIWTNMKTNASHEAIANEQNKVRRDEIAARERGDQLQYRVGMAGVGATNEYRKAMLEQNMIQKYGIAYQRGQDDLKNFMTARKLDAATMSPQDYATLQEKFMRNAFTGMGLPYTPGMGTSPSLTKTDEDLINKYKPKQ